MPPSSLPPAPETTSPSRVHPWLRRMGVALVAAASGAFLALAFPPYDYGNLVWIALLPLLSLLWCGRRGFWRGFGIGWFYGMGCYCVSFWWIHEVGNVFVGISMPVFLGLAFFPLMTLYALLPGLWAGLANTLLRPILALPPDTQGMTPAATKETWGKWALADMLSTLRCATGCAALWVCMEWLRGQGTLGFSWNSLGMALYNGLSLAQWAEFVGTSALAFIPVFTSVVLWGAFRRTYKQYQATGKGCRPWDFYGAVILLFALFTGGLMLSKINSPLMMMRRDTTLQLPVLAIQLNQDQKERIESPPDSTQYGLYLRATKAAFDDIQQATARKAMETPEAGIRQQLPLWVVWPESALPYPLLREIGTQELIPDRYTCNILLDPDQGLPQVRHLIREMGGQDFVLFTGTDELRLIPNEETGTLTRHGMYNSMACIPGGFDSILTVSKQHLMPFGEYIPLADSIEWINKTYSDVTGTQVGDGIHPGTGSDPIETPIPGTDETVGVIPAICYEDTVGNLLRKFIRKGPQVIVNITNDGWFRHSSCGVQQARAAAFRCIELRRPMVRAANMGVTCAIAPNGAVIDALLKADGTPHLPGYSYAVLPVDRNAGFTLYALLGDWAVLLCALLSIALSLPSLLHWQNAPDPRGKLPPRPRKWQTPAAS